MAVRPATRVRTGRTFAVVAGFVATAAIALLTYNVSREIELLGSARSDNVQWSLVQTQVEFLEFAQQIDKNPVDLTELRQDFDIFYSRVMTIKNATVFDYLRSDPASREPLNRIVAFLDQAVPLIDATDTDLIRQIPDLAALTNDVRPVVRALGNSGLEVFAQESDNQREAVARTMTQLALAIAALISSLTLAILYLNRLNMRIYRRERDVKQAATRMQTIISTSLDGVIVCNSKGHILEFSPAAEDIFGHLEKDVLGKDIGKMIVPNHLRDAHDAGMERMRKTGEKRVVGKGRVKLEAMHSDGHVFPIELAIQSATTDQGDIFIAFLRDISARVAAQAELVKARDTALANEKLKTEFLSTMSHEIRTPLNGLLGNMNLLRDTDLDENQDRYVGYMETSGRLLLNHVSDVLDITRYDAGRLSTRSEAVNVSALLQDIIDNQGSTAAKNETSLSWGWAGTRMDWVLSDHDRLQHVLMNLIGNAVKFTKRGTVLVTIENIGKPDAAELLIKIVDTGPGMTKELSQRVFDDFVTGNTAYDRDVGGTGLGLSIAKRFVNALGGKIGVDSVVGKGSAFWVTLPVQETQAPQTTQDNPEMHRPTRSLKVLLVEDNEINRIVAREMIQAEGHSVVEAHDGRHAVDLSKAEEFDLILMDISMPVMDGRTATRMIRSDDGASTNVDIFALTANAVIEEQEEFLKDGMTGILTKPLSRDALRGVLQQAERATAQREPALIDHNYSAEIRDAVGEETFVKLKSRFVKDVDALQVWLSSDERGDFQEIAARAHKIAGSAAIFGAVRLRETLIEIELNAKQSHSKAIKEGVKTLNLVWSRTKLALAS